VFLNWSGRRGEFKDFFSQEAGVVFSNDVCFVTQLGGHEHNQISGVCWLIRRK
jgi:hypothetical protein